MEFGGIVRKMDALGRIVLPIEYRTALGAHSGDEFVLTLTGDAIRLRKKPANVCMFCGGAADIRITPKGCLCRACAKDLSQSIHHVDMFPTK